MKSKEMQNLFGEPLVNECETRVVKNKTLAFKKKSKATQEYHYIPINNIKNRKPTKQFLNEMLEISKAGEYEIHQILYAIGQELTGGKQLPDFHQKSKSNLKISIPDAVRKEHDLIGDCYQYLTNKYERLKKGTFYTTEKIIESIVKNIEINENTSVFDPACGSGNLILNSKVKNPLQVHGLDIDPLAVMCCQFNYYLKFGNDAPTPDIRCGNFVDFVKQSRANNLKFDVILCNPPYGAEMEIKETYGSEIRSIDCLDYFVEHASQMAETSVFVLPETVINVKKHESLRSWILKKKKLAAVQSFGSSIGATLYNIVALTLNKNNNNFFIFDGKKVGYDFTIKMLDGKFRPIDQNDINFINKIYAVRHQTLGKCKHVTGIVTGDDNKFLMDMKSDDSEPIITGKNVEPYRITGEKYINYKDNRKQMAIAVKDSYFRTDEKLIYHTVSRYLEFAIDYNRRLTSGTANFFIVKDIAISNKCIMAIFNSKIYNRLNRLLFGDKVNRSVNIKKLPIPILTDAQQRKIEQCVDEERYEDIERFLEEFFRI
jgi:16S rRNA G966 N2-methylase RsmD